MGQPNDTAGEHRTACPRKRRENIRRTGAARATKTACAAFMIWEVLRRMKEKRIITFLLGSALLAAFTLFLDDSGIGMRERLRRMMAWTGKSGRA